MGQLMNEIIRTADAFAADFRGKAEPGHRAAPV